MGTYTRIATGLGGIQTRATAWPRPAFGSMGCGLLRACGSSPNGIVSRENGNPGGTTAKGPVGLGRTIKTGPCGFVLPSAPLEPFTCWARTGAAVPASNRSPASTMDIHIGDQYIAAGRSAGPQPISRESVGRRCVDGDEEERRSAWILHVMRRPSRDHH